MTFKEHAYIHHNSIYTCLNTVIKVCRQQMRGEPTGSVCAHLAPGPVGTSLSSGSAAQMGTPCPTSLGFLRMVGIRVLGGREGGGGPLGRGGRRARQVGRGCWERMV